MNNPNCNQRSMIRRFWSWVISEAERIGLLGAIGFLIAASTSLPIWFADLVKQHDPLLPWQAEPLRMTLFSITSCAISLVGTGLGIWFGKLGSCNRLNSWKWRLAALGSLGLLLTASFVFVTAVRAERSRDEHYACLFPEMSLSHTIIIDSYAVNGSRRHILETKGEAGGPDCYVKVTLEPFRSRLDHQAGFVMAFRFPISVARFEKLSFMVRGKEGKEKIGIKLGDVGGSEVEQPVDKKYLNSVDHLSKNWQQITIPLSDLKVDHRAIKRIVLFTRGNWSCDIDQNAEVGGISQAFDFGGIGFR